MILKCVSTHSSRGGSPTSDRLRRHCAHRPGWLVNSRDFLEGLDDMILRFNVCAPSSCRGAGCVWWLAHVVIVMIARSQRGGGWRVEVFTCM